MAPEQATGRDDEIDARTDVYGLGAVLYELLTGRPPFLGTMYEVLRRTVSERPVPPNHVVKLKQGSGEAPRGIPPIPAALESLCLRCLEKGREGRPSSALQVGREVEAILQGPSPIPPAAERGSTAHVPAVGPARPARRAWMAAAVAAVFVAGAAGALLVVSGRDDAVRAREALARFQPELAETLDLPGELRDEAAVVARFKRKLIEAAGERQPEIPELRIGGRRLEKVKVWRARSEVAVLDAGSGPDAAAWADLGAAGVAALARACGLVEVPDHRLGLALACLAMGDEVQGRQLLESLRGTPVEGEALRRLARLPSKG
jgi:hypothetical protein